MADEPIKKEEVLKESLPVAGRESSSEDSKDLFYEQPVADIEKPDPVVPRTAEEEQYFEEHKGLPTHEERPESEVLQEEAEQVALRERETQEMEAKKAELGTLSTAVAAVEATQKSDMVLHVESVLQDGLAEYFQTMSPEQQQKFKTVGEETAGKIATMLASAKVRVDKILDLIRHWLHMIPGFNKFFIEQESKIKTDAILKIKQEG